jgi:hypothetical protein
MKCVLLFVISNQPPPSSNEYNITATCTKMVTVNSMKNWNQREIEIDREERRERKRRVSKQRLASEREPKTNVNQVFRPLSFSLFVLFSVN